MDARASAKNILCVTLVMYLDVLLNRRSGEAADIAETEGSLVSHDYFGRYRRYVERETEIEPVGNVVINH